MQSIWDLKPEDWEDEKSNPDEQTKRSVINENQPEVNTPKHEINSLPSEDNSKGRKSKKNKISKKELDAFEKETSKGQYVSDKNQEVIAEEEEKNKHDLKMMFFAMSVVFVIIFAALFLFMSDSTQKIHRLIDDGNYVSAHLRIKEAYEHGKNVDSLVYAFAEHCIDDSEYIRAIKSLDYLSKDAPVNEAFFEKIVKTLYQHGKDQRINDVIDFMYRRGDDYRELADRLLEEIYNE